MSRAIRIHETGDADVLRWETVDVGDPAPGEVRLRQTAIGINFIDIYQRSGLYPLPALPATIGLEAAGVVEAVGEGVADIGAGMRVAYASPPPGAYAERRLMPADRLIPLPDAIDERTAAAMMLKGMTAQYLLRQTHRVAAGDTVLIYAAAGGVGLIACQWAKYVGATVIGAVGSEAKAEVARAHGCDHVIVYSRESVRERVRALTDGQGVDVVYDSVGKDTFFASLDCLRPRGLMVTYGNASGPVPPIEPALLAQKGSLFLTRPTLFHYTASAAALRTTAADLFSVVLAGHVTIRIGATYPLADAAIAHRDLEQRRTTGSVLLLP